MEQHGREFLQRKGRKFRVLFSDKILVKPMPVRWIEYGRVNKSGGDPDVRLFYLKTYPF